MYLLKRPNQWQSTNKEKKEKEEDKAGSNMIILRKSMKDFVGLETVGEDIK